MARTTWRLSSPSADFADALKQAVLADMDVRPDGFHQLPLAQDTAGIAGEQPEYLQGLGPQPDRPAIGGAQLGARRVELKTGKAQHRSPPAGNGHNLVPGSPAKMGPNA